MFNRWRLPLDNYPDDTETVAFQNYSEGTSSRVWQLPLKWRQWLIYAGLGVIALLVGLGALFVYRSLTDGTEPTTVNLPSSTTTPIPVVMQGNFPSQVPQIYINVPARIDDSLVGGQILGYTFFSNAGITWVIELFPDTSSGLAPRITLYGNDGQQLVANEQVVNDRVTITYFVENEGLYAILLEGISGSSGGYTLRILPADL